MDIKAVPMVRLSWDDARDMETGWLPIKDMLNAPLAKCQEVGWLIVNNKEKVVLMRSAASLPSHSYSALTFQA